MVMVLSCPKKIHSGHISVSMFNLTVTRSEDTNILTIINIRQGGGTHLESQLLRRRQQEDHLRILGNTV